MGGESMNESCCTSRDAVICSTSSLWCGTLECIIGPDRAATRVQNNNWLASCFPQLETSYAGSGISSMWPANFFRATTYATDIVFLSHKNADRCNVCQADRGIAGSLPADLWGGSRSWIWTRIDSGVSIERSASQYHLSGRWYGLTCTGDSLQIRSMIDAIPIPPPIHIVTSPRVSSRRSSSSSTVPISILPVAPSG